MNPDRIFENLREEVEKLIPKEMNVSAIAFEGSVVVIYTTEYDKFSGNDELPRTLAQNLRRRVDIRPDPTTLEDTETVREKILSMIPGSAEVFDVNFIEETGEAIIEAINPNEVLGKEGQLLSDIKKESGWNVKVIRAPPIPSKTVSDVRGYIRTYQDDRHKMLKSVARNLVRPAMLGDQWVRITTMGGFRQVGRSASLLTTRDSKILIDCGLDPSSDATPYFGIPEVQPLEKIDAVVVTHAHMDHCGTLPALYKYGYEGPVYCTPPTRDLMALLQLDNIKLGFGEAKKQQYEAQHVRKEIMHTITLKYNETTDIAPDVRLTFHNAGHILGSAIAHFHIGDGLHNVAFSGDTKYEKTWLFNPANNRFPRLETLVIESTYGGHNDVQPSRVDASEEMKEILKQAAELGGKVLIPVFAVGRSQEVMLVIEELMRTGKIPQMNVYLDGMIWEATAIHTAYPEYLNSQLRTQIFQQNENPFLSPIFKRVETSIMREEICHSPDSCIVLATSGMMAGGPVMEYFKEWADDAKNTLIFVGYQSEGSLGRTIQRGRQDITLNSKGKQIDLDIKMNRVTVDGFSGHSDRKQLMKYIQSLEPKPSKIIIGHGEDRKCTDLASSIYKKFNIETKAPLNLETIRLR
ncbi:putative hydrolase [Candidatus Methanoplasma termitum]|uniref:Transcription termination factor FttA n=1 Tax=Candidatus Methanoplasma termitum TaxID=1577791 RepID=A0A0A7LB84_9ARCH|nr:beta-CASP ribonuclease aCPSF1 [Candidatus Methanoplasma termitum]AIZ56420.1 putative hydrolase [Candidatus Methanoplasma termitum]MCL2333735.1 beta-CASP ribonuclease aCPSF1 [Candidatus Methanoplasma sp.]